jgi:hypothetical protein
MASESIGVLVAQALTFRSRTSLPATKDYSRTLRLHPINSWSWRAVFFLAALPGTHDGGRHESTPFEKAALLPTAATCSCRSSANEPFDRPLSTFFEDFCGSTKFLCGRKYQSSSVGTMSTIASAAFARFVLGAPIIYQRRLK